jgi:hypothetical protein
MASLCAGWARNSRAAASAVHTIPSRKISKLKAISIKLSWFAQATFVLPEGKSQNFSEVFDEFLQHGQQQFCSSY